MAFLFSRKKQRGQPINGIGKVWRKREAGKKDGKTIKLFFAMARLKFCLWMQIYANIIIGVGGCSEEKNKRGAREAQ